MKIVTDSSVMFSIEEGARRGLTVLPLTVSIEGETYLEYEDISSEDFLARVRAGALPQSSSPPPGLTLEAYDTDEEIVHISMAHGLSGAYEVACGLVKQARHPERVHVVNSQTLCIPQRALAFAATAAVAQGRSAAEVVGLLKRMRESACSYLIPEDFDYLRRGGRLTPLAAKFAHMIKAFPLLVQTEDGTRLEKRKIARSFIKAVETIASDFASYESGEGRYISVSHAGNLAQASIAANFLSGRFPAAQVGVFELGPAFITQGGPGCIAVQSIDLRFCPGIVMG
ncbi:MAG: DegV family protein [Gordonibacter sp.]|nr:DegV family protein [Gordonibacter sp.]